MRFALFPNHEKHELHLVQQAKAGDEQALHDLLVAHTPFIKKTASFVCKRTIDEQDEEFSIAFLAFHEAVEKYEPGASAKLTTFAHLIIKRRIIDFIRKEVRVAQAVSGEAADIELTHKAMDAYSEHQLKTKRQEDIASYQLALFPYNLTFEELTRIAPKHEDSRRTMIAVARIIADTPEFVEHLEAKRTLPLKEIEQLVDVSRKTLERHRKYIIALVVLLAGDFTTIQHIVKGGTE